MKFMRTENYHGGNVKRKIKNTWVLIISIALFLSAVPVFSWGDSTPDSDTEGFSNDDNAMEDFGFYTGDYDPADFDDTDMMDGLVEAYYSAMSAYAQAVQSGNKAEIAAWQGVVHETQQAVIMYADCHQDQYTVSYNFEDGKGCGVFIEDNKTGEMIMKAGDPVMLCSGVFVLDEKDLIVKCAGTIFTINRYFSSEEWNDNWGSGGVFGNKWASVLDSRIIRGSSIGWEKYLSRLNKSLINKRDILQEMVDDNSTEAIEVLPDMRKFYKDEYYDYVEVYNQCVRAVENKKLSEKAYFGFSGYYAAEVGSDCLVYVDEKGTPLVFEKSAYYENLYECSYEKLAQKLKIQVGEELIERSIEEWSDEIELIDEELLAMEIPFCESADEILERLSQRERTADVFYLIDQKGNRRVFNDEGFIQEIQYENGGEITFVRDDAGNAVMVKVNGGRSVELDYFDQKLVTVTDGVLSVKYDYDENGMLSSFTDKDGDQKKFVYDDSFNLLKVVKADSNFSSFEYKSFGDGKLRTVATTNENGFKERFDYDLKKMKTVYSDYDDVKTQVFYDENGRTVREIHSDGLEKCYVWNDLSEVEQIETNGEIIRYEYDDERNVTGILYSDGTAEKWTYENGRIKTYTDRKSVIYSYGYDSAGNCTDFYRNGWLIKKSSFNKNGSLRFVQDEFGSVEEFVYDSKGNLKSLKKRDKANNVLKLLEFEYDESGRPVKVSEDNRRVTDLVYGNHFVKSKSNDGYETETYYSSRKDTVKHVVRDALSGVSIVHDYKWDNCHNLIEAYTNGILVESNSYSAGGRLVKRTIPYNEDRNIVYEYVWKNGAVVSLKKYFSDKNGNVIGKIAATDFSMEWKEGRRYSSILRDGINTSYLYDLQNRLVEKTVNGTVVEKNEYSQGHLTRSSKNGMGNLIFNYDERSFFTGSFEETGTLGPDFFEMSDTGLLLSYTDRSGFRTVYEYDGNGKEKSISSVKGITLIDCNDGVYRQVVSMSNAEKILEIEKWEISDLGRTVKYSSGEKYCWTKKLDVWGNVTDFTDGEGNTWKMKYDCFNNCISRTDPYGNEIKFEYNLDGTLRKTIECNGSVTSYEYDIDSNCIEVRNENGVLFKGEYDCLGRLVSKEEIPFSAKITYEYDESGRIVKLKRGNRVVLENMYDQKTIVSVDASGNKTLNVTDGYLRTESITNRLGAVKEFKYNSDGTTLFSSDFNKDVTDYSYSSDGLTLTIKYSDGTYVKEQRDYLNRIIRVENENGWELFEYDTGGKLLNQYDSFTGEKVTFSYDKRGLLVKATGCGRSISYVYGKTGELKKVIEDDDFDNVKNHLEVSFEYDSNGRKIEQVYSSGEKQKFYYDKGSRLILTVGYDSDGKIVMVEGNVYDKNGFRTLVLNSDFTVTRYKYDEDGNLCGVQYPYSQETEAYLGKLCFDAGIHNIGKSVSVKRGMISSAEYGVLNNLCMLIGHGQYCVVTNFNVLEETYKYDLKGNMISRETPYGIIEYSYDKENRLVKWGNGCKAEYDFNGNMISRSDVVSDGKFKYSKRNRVVTAQILDKITEKNSDVNYGYDAFGRRNYTSSIAGGFKTVYSGFSFEELATIQCSEKLHPVQIVSSETGYRYFNGEVKSISDVNVNNSRNYAALYADSSTPVALINFGGNSGNELLFANLTGTIGGCQNYDAFGAPLKNECLFGFAGKKYNPETKTYNFGYRDYDITSGRFTTTDPIYDGLNWYTYCKGDPVNYVDPLGLKFQEVSDREMQEFADVLLGKSEYETLGTKGCLVTAFSEIISQFTGVNFTAKDVNAIKGMFTAGNLVYNSIAAVFGLAIEIIRSPNFVFNNKTEIWERHTILKTFSNIEEMLSMDALTILDQTRDVMAAYWYDQISEYIEADDYYSIIAQVLYNNEDAHFVHVTSNVTVIDGKGYVQIAGTSRYDKAGSLGNNRQGVGWITKNGKVFVPAKNITKLVACEKR